MGVSEKKKEEKVEVENKDNRLHFVFSPTNAQYLVRGYYEDRHLQQFLNHLTWAPRQYAEEEGKCLHTGSPEHAKESAQRTGFSQDVADR